MKVLETDRLVLRFLTPDDAEFMFELLNSPGWLEFIGDKGIKTVEDARDYILKGPVEMYNRLGFGLYLTELKADAVPIGVCGLIKRDGLEDVDIGYAFLPNFWGKGYAYESAAGVLAYGKEVLGINRIVAITSTDNLRSAKLLEKLGLQFERMVKLSNDGEEIRLFGM
ncbi:N-acetyltransferase [Paenibacillus albiflavus]|uniref:N-acetyltransferase n=1 Tax=Paenibacillus albiflavus TaxID=2545760 RepID=A0A4R4EJ95_9BACL|nr:GNAT family N-acetyltransferase [Paenibacillus albiflavus]TCZ78431.1 N-acetyltransferase [Paenibacillus albiflavus]